jgi:hypothetical protein
MYLFNALTVTAILNFNNYSKAKTVCPAEGNLDNAAHGNIITA